MKRFILNSIAAVGFALLFLPTSAQADLCTEAIINADFFEKYDVFYGTVVELRPVTERQILKRGNGNIINGSFRDITLRVDEAYSEGLSHFYTFEEMIGIGGKEFREVGVQTLMVTYKTEVGTFLAKFCPTLDRQHIIEFRSGIIKEETSP